MTSLPNLTIEPLTPDRFADVATLFEEGGDPKWCWWIYFVLMGDTLARLAAPSSDLARYMSRLRWLS